MRHKSLPERTAEVICDMLYRENYRIGAKLPGELKLAEMLEVSRNTDSGRKGCAGGRAGGRHFCVLQDGDERGSIGTFHDHGQSKAY